MLSVMASLQDRSPVVGSVSVTALRKQADEPRISVVSWFVPFYLKHLWSSLSAAQDDDMAKKALDALEQTMRSDQIAEAQKLAAEWKPTK